MSILNQAYATTKKQIGKINLELIEKDAPIRIISRKETAGENRNKTYWQIVSVKEHEEHMKK